MKETYIHRSKQIILGPGYRKPKGWQPNPDRHTLRVLISHLRAVDYDLRQKEKRYNTKIQKRKAIRNLLRKCSSLLNQTPPLINWEGEAVWHHMIDRRHTK